MTPIKYPVEKALLNLPIALAWCNIYKELDVAFYGKQTDIMQLNVIIP